MQLAHSAQTFEPDTSDAREDRRLREALFDLRDALLSHLQKQTHETNIPDPNRTTQAIIGV
ncbi:hypothetical protein EMIT0P395_90114 [Pseudomonas sp. IT-P395]